MPDFLKRRVGRPSVGWLWPLALLALPSCADIIGIDPWTADAALTTAVFCDIPKPPPPAPLCIKPDEIPLGIRQASAAVSLNTGDTGTITIDESETALAACAADTGGPQAVEFLSIFPNGKGGCLDPASLTDANAFCVTLCNQITDAADPAFCSSHAHVSTNVPLTGFPGGCTPDGSLSMFVDPRPTPEKVDWDPLSLIGVTPVNGNGLQRTANTSLPLDNPPFDAGAASTQRIEHGDAYVEFSASENTLSHVIGLTQIPDGCAAPCTDTDPSLTDINFAISLNKDLHFYVIESGVLITTGPDLNGSFGTYDPNDPIDPKRFRVSLRQSSDGSKTATVTYSRVSNCVPGNPCPEDVFYTHDGVANYPLRVDTSFREVNAVLNDVTLVRIK